MKALVRKTIGAFNLSEMPITLPLVVQKCIYVAPEQAGILHLFGSQIYNKCNLGGLPWTYDFLKIYYDEFLVEP